MADPETLKRALKSFRKRIRLMKQDDESRLSHGAMTMGERSAIVGIRPPGEFPQAIWEELVQQGKLRYEGHGLYALVEDQGARE